MAIATIDVDHGTEERIVLAMYAKLAEEAVKIACDPMTEGSGPYDDGEWNVRICPGVVERIVGEDWIDTSLGTPVAIGSFETESYMVIYYINADGIVTSDERS